LYAFIVALHGYNGTLYAFFMPCFREHATLYAFIAALRVCNGTLYAFIVTRFREHVTVYACNVAWDAYGET
jgi:hypothetical protein